MTLVEEPSYCGYCGLPLTSSPQINWYNRFTAQQMRQLICPNRPSAAPDNHDMWIEKNGGYAGGETWDRE